MENKTKNKLNLHPVTLLIQKDTFEEIRLVGEKLGLKRNSLIRLAINEFISKHKVES